jgi:hypothetical protein
MAVAILDPAKKTLNKTFGAHGKSHLTTSSNQKLQCWDYPARNLIMGWIPKSKRTFSSLQQSFTHPKADDVLGITIVGRWPGLLKIAFLSRLERWKKNKIWGSSGGILSLNWIPKTWKTLTSFYPLLILLYPQNGLDVTEFWRLTLLLNSVSGQNGGGTALNFWVSDWTKLWKSKIPLR